MGIFAGKMYSSSEGFVKGLDSRGEAFVISAQANIGGWLEGVCDSGGKTFYWPILSVRVWPMPVSGSGFRYQRTR